MSDRECPTTDAPAEGHEAEIDQFIRRLTDHQVDLQGFILSSLGSYSDALDVLQQTNIALWKKADQFHAGSPFMPWALQVAKYEILAFLRKRRRDRHQFSSEVVELMVDMAIQRSSNLSQRSEALMDCIKELPERSRHFLAIRYASDRSVSEVAEISGRTVEAVKSVFLRIRRSLEECIDRRLTSEARS
ncbi:sigma-70 family RNA polymerase sigma factor [Botrimarina mediterranea]|nr:sigma-70 family RNA polymerase sigma factor [Botrimarina mediterranea]